MNKKLFYNNIKSTSVFLSNSKNKEFGINNNIKMENEIDLCNPISINSEDKTQIPCIRIENNNTIFDKD